MRYLNCRRGQAPATLPFTGRYLDVLWLELWFLPPAWTEDRYAGIVIVVQALLIAALAGTVHVRAQARRALNERRRDGRVLGELSDDFAGVVPDRVDDEIGRWLGRIVTLFDVDRAALVQFSSDGPPPRPMHAGALEDTARSAGLDALEQLPHCAEMIRQGRTVRLRRLDELPPEAQRDWEMLRAAATGSLLAVPLSVGGQALGYLALVTRRRERDWPEELVQRVRMVGEVFANAIVRRNWESALRNSDALCAAVLASLSARVAVLDQAGTILRVNDAWRDAALVLGSDQVATGANYLDVCRAAARQEPAAGEVVLAIEAVLRGEHPEGVRMEYASASPVGEHWYELVVEPLRRPQGGAIVAHSDCTTRKRAELDAQTHRAEAAHAARAATLGELSAGLAHELNQPLAAILTNVQASQRLLATERPRIELLREILADIAADDVRASEVIRRMRALLTKGRTEFQPLDLNELTRDVLRLLASDAILRRVRIRPQLEPDLPGVRGDRVQLQQVILNLLVNGLDAMAETFPARRHLEVRTLQPEEDWVEITVRDNGAGIPPEVLRRLYEPFFSTKRDGLGMGLSICRSIAEAHGGSLQASNNPEGGATFAFRLPIAEARRAHGEGVSGPRGVPRRDDAPLRGRTPRRP